jgi:hypothetical protein
MQYITSSPVGYHLVTFADGLPYGALPPYSEGGPALVTVGAWCVSTDTVSGEAGVISHVRNYPDGPHGKPSPHPVLDGQRFASREEARKAQYEAGVIQYMIYQETTLWDQAKALMAPPLVIEVTKGRMYSDMTRRSSNYYECAGPDGRRFTNTSIVTLRRKLRETYGAVTVVVV